MRHRPTLVATLVFTADAARAANPVPGLEGSGWQALIGLAAVLATIAGAAWLLRRFSQVVGGGSGPLSTIAVLAVGQKERVVLVQCSDTWIVLGVAPGRVSPLHAMPRPEAAAGGDSSSSATVAAATSGIPGFRQWLDKALTNRAR
jgi:flagellar protein FliO/FliZ